MQLCGSLSILWHFLSLGLEVLESFKNVFSKAPSKSGNSSNKHSCTTIYARFFFQYQDIHDIGLHSWWSGKESTCSEGETGHVGSIPGLGRSPRIGNGSPLQYSCLENSMVPEEPNGLQSMRSQRAGHDWAHTHAHTHTHTRYNIVLLQCIAWFIFCPLLSVYEPKHLCVLNLLRPFFSFVGNL